MKDFINDNKFLCFLLFALICCLFGIFLNYHIVNAYVVNDTYGRYFDSIEDYRIYKLEEVSYGRID